ncbi:glycoside hydrolase family 5 protein [Methylobacterium planeticum]|nr:cellulase family glycosylhydrolase [Methylobacterium planeticum]
MPPAEMRRLTDAGLDFVRLALDPGPYLQFTGWKRDWADRFLIDTVRGFLAAGLGVIVDLHPSDLHPDYESQALTVSSRSSGFQAYLGLVSRIAGLLTEIKSEKVALELMNEPTIGSAAWQPMLEAAYKAARSRAPRLSLVLGGGNQNAVSGLTGMDTRPFADDPAVLYTFHAYDPFQFTHQGASWNAAALLADVPYPARARPLNESLDAMSRIIAQSDMKADAKPAALATATRQLESYQRSGFDRGALAKVFDEVGEWARSRTIAPQRILLGEFGARLTPASTGAAQQAERERWFRDMRELAEAKGFAWSAFTYRGSGGFALARNEVGPGLDPIVARGLGLRRMEAAPHRP